MALSHTIFSTELFESTFNNDLQDLADKLLLESQQPGVTKSNVNGYQSKDDLHLQSYMSEIVQWIKVESIQAFASYGFHKEIVNMESCWFNVNKGFATYNNSHLHSAILSGVFYVKAPEGSGHLTLFNNGLNQLWPGHTKSNFANANNSSFVDIPPEEGKLYIWPSYLLHNVAPNKKDVERISISFNLE